MQPPVCIIAGDRSGSGKTVTTLALARALQRRGVSLALGKIGPDYIDAAYLAGISGKPSCNVDLWMQGRDGAARVLARARDCAGDLLLLEGAMGLCDGGESSAAALAGHLQVPVLLLLSCQGLAETVAPILQGFLDVGRQSRVLISGLILTHVGSLRHRELLESAIRPLTADTALSYLGCLPKKGAPIISSRHLGLVSFEESRSRLSDETLVPWIEDNLDIPLFLKTFGIRDGRRSGLYGDPGQDPESCPGIRTKGCPERGPGRDSGEDHEEDASRTDTTSLSYALRDEKRLPRGQKIRIPVAIARDAAFAFCYSDLPEVLREMGAEITYFSPLKDQTLPEALVYYFPGGYPELHADALSKNAACLDALRYAEKTGAYLYGECGGYIYLQERLLLEGREYRFLGTLPGTVCMGEHLQTLGYREAELVPWFPTSHAITVRGHEFHYSRVRNRYGERETGRGEENASETETLGNAQGEAEIRESAQQDPVHPLWKLYDREGRFLSDAGMRIGRVFGSYLHLAPEGSRMFWKAVLAEAGKSVGTRA